MKKRLFAFCMIGVTFSLLHAEPFGTIRSLVGRAKVYSSSRKAWKSARINQKLFPEDKVKTGQESRLEIRSSAGGIVRIDELSEILLAAKSANDQGVRIRNGRIWANIKKIAGKKTKFKVQTPSATAAIRGTVFRVNAEKDATTDVLVYNGQVEVGPSDALKKTIQKKAQPAGPVEIGPPTEVEGPKEVSLETWVSIVAGQQISVSPDGGYKKFEFNQEKDAQDHWVKYNLEQDRSLDQ